MRIYFSPSIPKTQDYSIIAMIHYLGYSVAKTIDDPFDFAYMWDDNTYINPSEDLLNLTKEKIVLNINCIDISKIYVDKILKEVCGYESLIDPTLFNGKCIKKCNENGKGGGEIVTLNNDNFIPSEAHVYQKYVETNPNGPQLEYRVPIVMGTIPLIFEVYKDNPEKVENKLIKNQMKHSIKLKETASVFSEKEHVQILLFCQKIGLDIGELDILRCKNTNRMYIIDANTTPTYFNMFNRYWDTTDKRKAIAVLANKWEEQLLKVLPVI